MLKKSRLHPKSGAECETEYQQEWFFYFSLIKNIASMLEYGILSKNTVESMKIQYDSFAYETVQEKRHHTQICLSSGRFVGIHDLVPVYLTPRTPTLYAKLDLKDSLCFAVIDASIVLDASIEFAFTDGNAGSSYTNFYNKADELNQIPWAEIRTKYWNQHHESVRKRNAEFLIYPKIETQYISWLVVNSPYSCEAIEEMLYLKDMPSIKVTFDPWYFFG
jgi:hypothetical protein